MSRSGGVSSFLFEGHANSIIVGSGSTLLAADQTGHRAFLMELDPLYWDVSVQRFEKFTGQKARRDSVDKRSKRRA
jgi:DNA modification methylase